MAGSNRKIKIEAINFINTLFLIPPPSALVDGSRLTKGRTSGLWTGRRDDGAHYALGLELWRLSLASG